MLRSINPATGEVIATYPTQVRSEIEGRLRAAASAQKAWSQTSLTKRVAGIERIGQLLERDADRYAALITREMGKPITEARGEIAKCAWNCRYYGTHAEAMLAPDPVVTTAAESFVAYEPLGLVLAVMPWNFPFWQVVRCAVPVLLAGNGFILKHASNVSGCALALADLFGDAGLPKGLFTSLLVEPEEVEWLIADPRVAAVTLTGSTRVGRIVASHAGRELKKQVLELGGSDPFVVLDDADVRAAAKAAALARNQNAGQSCVSAKRFIVEDSVAEAFTAAFCAAVGSLIVGDPVQESTHVGPMARDDLRHALRDQIDRSLAMGARLRLGGHMPNGPGFYFTPTVLDDVVPGMPAFDEETFGPLAAVIRARDADHAIALANSTVFGLGASIWTHPDRGRTLAGRVEAGAVFVNGAVASDPRLPFGGIKQSGYGRELGLHGIREFTNVKTVWIGPARAAA